MPTVYTGDGKSITYTLTYKKVKNVNLRVKGDGSVCVSANKRVSKDFVEKFVLSNSDFILKALERCRQRAEIPVKQYFTEEQLKDFITEFCKIVYPYYQQLGVEFPTIKFRKMTSKWGSCHTQKNMLLFNTNLMYAPPQCVEYVVWHEFTHFLQPNHSKLFYNELEKVCSDWKLYRKWLKNIRIGE